MPKTKSATIAPFFAAFALSVVPQSTFPCEAEYEINDFWTDDSVLSAEITFRGLTQSTDKDRFKMRGSIVFQYAKDGNEKLLKARMPVGRTQDGFEHFEIIGHNGVGHNYSELVVMMRSPQYNSIYSIAPRGCDQAACTLKNVTIRAFQVSCGS